MNNFEFDALLLSMAEFKLAILSNSCSGKLYICHSTMH